MCERPYSKLFPIAQETHKVQYYTPSPISMLTINKQFSVTILTSMVQEDLLVSYYFSPVCQTTSEILQFYHSC